MSGAGGLLHETEDPAIAAANLNVGVRLFGSAVAFVFVAFVFAFFYLKAVNSFGQWHPAHTKPSQGYGIAILVCVLGTALAFELGRRDLVRAGGGMWRLGAAVALTLSVAVLALQILQYTSLGFGATHGGYASVFYGFTLLFAVMWLGSIYWVETLLAGTLRGLPAPERGAGSPLEPLRPSAEACMVWLYLMVGIEVVAYVLLYLIK